MIDTDGKFVYKIGMIKSLLNISYMYEVFKNCCIQAHFGEIIMNMTFEDKNNTKAISN